MVRREIMKFRVFLFLQNDSAWNFEHFYLPQNGSEQNYKVPSFFIFQEMVRNGISEFFHPSRNGSEQNSEHFPIRKTDGIPTE
jgi:hypothetical protein